MRSMLEEFAVFNNLSDIIVDEDVESLLCAFKDEAVASFFVVGGFSGFSNGELAAKRGARAPWQQNGQQAPDVALRRSVRPRRV